MMTILGGKSIILRHPYEKWELLLENLGVTEAGTWFWEDEATTMALI